mmetsp:Transcript_2366/g.3436  ORF Transcript_2366/g.3436 Transcript_2366/m.3436 type:complete len:374 (+) Transcript_2366:71-1192(+)
MKFGEPFLHKITATTPYEKCVKCQTCQTIIQLNKRHAHQCRSNLPKLVKKKNKRRKKKTSKAPANSSKLDTLKKKQRIIEKQIKSDQDFVAQMKEEDDQKDDFDEEGLMSAKQIRAAIIQLRRKRSGTEHTRRQKPKNGNAASPVKNRSASSRKHRPTTLKKKTKEQPVNQTPNQQTKKQEKTTIGPQKEKPIQAQKPIQKEKTIRTQHTLCMGSSVAIELTPRYSSIASFLEECEKAHFPISLSFDLWDRILTFLKVSDIQNMGYVCKSFHFLTSRNPLWLTICQRDFRLLRDQLALLRVRYQENSSPLALKRDYHRGIKLLLRYFDINDGLFRMKLKMVSSPNDRLALVVDRFTMDNSLSFNDSLSGVDKT